MAIKTDVRAYLAFKRLVFKDAWGRSWGAFKPDGNKGKDLFLFGCGFLLRLMLSGKDVAIDDLLSALFYGVGAVATAVLLALGWNLVCAPYRLYRQELATAEIAKEEGKAKVNEAEENLKNCRHSSAALAMIDMLKRDIPALDAAVNEFEAQAAAALETLKAHREDNEISAEFCYRAARKTYDRALKRVTDFAEVYPVKWPDAFKDADPPDAHDVIPHLQKLYRILWVKFQSDRHKVRTFRNDLNLNGRLQGEQAFLRDETYRRLRG